jgi:CubicO group peptidase (beta-lactamase class C family)
MIGWIAAVVVVVQVSSYDWAAVNAVVQEGYLQGAYPGGVLKIANATHTLHEHVVGFLTKPIAPYSTPPFTMDTIFDVASLTKVTATLTCIMHLYEMEVIDIDDRVVEYVPEYANHGKDNTTIKNLLLHNAGLLEDPPSE